MIWQTGVSHITKNKKTMKRQPRETIDYTTWTVEQFKEDLKTKPEYLDYYAKFDPASIDAFVDRYAGIKFQMFQNRDGYKHGTESFKARFIELADKCIDYILQKKLFNLQCQWRAGLIDLPMVQISREFDYWSRRIRACPFIPLVTPEDIDLCTAFLEKEYDFFVDAHFIGNKWQDYDTFKDYLNREENEDDESEEEVPFSLYNSIYPPMYLYFDTYQNTSSLINLPDLRGEKEDVFINLAYHIERIEKEEREKLEPKDVTPAALVPREPYKPNLFWGDNEIKTFVEAVENQEVIEAHGYYFDNYHLDRDYEFEECFMYLRDFKEPFPIEANDDWREAIQLMLRRQTQLRAADLLPYVYEAYLLEFDEPHNFKKIVADKIARHKYDPEDSLWQLIEKYKRLILKARKACREPEDFDYFVD